MGEADEVIPSIEDRDFGDRDPSKKRKRSLQQDEEYEFRPRVQNEYAFGRPLPQIDPSMPVTGPRLKTYHIPFTYILSHR